MINMTDVIFFFFGREYCFNGEPFVFVYLFEETLNDGCIYSAQELPTQISNYHTIVSILHQT